MQSRHHQQAHLAFFSVPYQYVATCNNCSSSVHNKQGTTCRQCALEETTAWHWEGSWNPLSTPHRLHGLAFVPTSAIAACALLRMHKVTSTVAQPQCALLNVGRLHPITGKAHLNRINAWMGYIYPATGAGGHLYQEEVDASPGASDWAPSTSKAIHEGRKEVPRLFPSRLKAFLFLASRVVDARVVKSMSDPCISLSA